MAAKVRLELNRDAIRDLLRSDDVRYLVRQYGAEVLDKVQNPDLVENNREGYELVTFTDGDRASAVVRTVTQKAREDAASNHSLERALGSLG